MLVAGDRIVGIDSTAEQQLAAQKAADAQTAKTKQESA